MRRVAPAEGGVPGEKGAPDSPQGGTDLTLWLPVAAVTSEPHRASRRCGQLQGRTTSCLFLLLEAERSLTCGPSSVSRPPGGQSSSSPHSVPLSFLPPPCQGPWRLCWAPPSARRIRPPSSADGNPRHVGSQGHWLQGFRRGVPGTTILLTTVTGSLALHRDGGARLGT